MTHSDLKTVSRKHLARMARDQRIPGWHSMRKDELVDALVHVAGKNGHRNETQHKKNGSRRIRTDARSGSGQQPCRLQPAMQLEGRPVRDQLLLEEIETAWLRAKWQLSRRILDRAEAALGAEWRQAIPVLRLYEVSDRNGTTAEKTFVKDEEIQFPKSDWFVPLERCGGSYRVELGYRTRAGAFFLLAGSARISTARMGTRSNSDANGTITERLQTAEAPRTSTNSTANSRTANGSRKPPTSSEHEFHVDTEVVFHGCAHPRSDLSLLGRSVQPAEDGSFRVQMPLDDGRQVIPVVCITPSGCTKRTIVLALERNTKQLEPQSLHEMM